MLLIIIVILNILFLKIGTDQISLSKKNLEGVRMEIITMVKGKIPESSLKEFKAAYALIKEESIPEGLIASYLLKDMIESDLYTVETVWANPEILKIMMESDETSADVKLFETFGVDPTVEVFEVRDSYPQFEE